MNAILDINTMSNTTMGDMLDQMTEINSSMVEYIFHDSTSNDEQPIAAVIVIKGENTARYIDAIAAEKARLESSSEVAS